MSVEESQLYRDLMRLRPDGWTPNAWAVAAGVSRTVWTDMRRHGNPSRRTLEKLLTAAGSSLAEFEALRVGNQGLVVPTQAASAVADASIKDWRAAPLARLPLVASACGGTWRAGDIHVELTDLNSRHILERLARPPSLAGDDGAFALTVVSNAMWPRYRVGRRIAVSPKAPVAAGDDVLITIVRPKTDGSAKSLISELVHRGGGYLELRQYNPEATFRILEKEVFSVQKVAGELI